MLTTVRAIVLGATIPLLVACGGGLSEAEGAWCSENQDAVARVAIELGEMDPGTRYSVWLQNDPDGFDRACREAYARAGAQG